MSSSLLETLLFSSSSLHHNSNATWIWPVILSLTGHLEKSFFYFVLFSRYFVLKICSNMEFFNFLSEIYNTRFGWFDLKFVKHARWIFVNLHTICKRWPGFEDKKQGIGDFEVILDVRFLSYSKLLTLLSECDFSLLLFWMSSNL